MINIKQLLIKSKIKKLSTSRNKLRDIFKKVYWLEFENECILKFLSKYNFMRKIQENPSIVTKETKIKEYVDLTHKPEFIITEMN